MKRFTSFVVLLLLSLSPTAIMQAQITITSFTPTSGPVGTPVTLTGTGLNLVSSIQFGGQDQPVFTINSSTSLTAVVPSGALTGTIDVSGGIYFASTPTPFTLTILAPATTAPTFVTANSFTANWTPSAGVDHYILDVSTDPGFGTGTFVGVYHNAYIGPEYELINSLTVNTIYYYRVRAVGQANDTSDYSNVTSVLTLDTPVAAGATNITTTGFTAHWSSVASASGYVIDVVTRWTFGLEGQITGYFNYPVGNVTSFAVTNLTPDTTYYYRVRATTSNGQSQNSNYIIVPRITTAWNLPSITVGVPFYKVMAAIGGTAPYTWTITGGSTPTGITLTSAGLLSGTPTVLGSFNFTAQITDQDGSVTSKSFTLPVISTTTIRFDTATTQNIYGFNGSSMSWQHPISNGTNRMLVVLLGGEDTSAARLSGVTVTYNGVSLTKATADSVTGSGRTDISQIWYMGEAQLPSSGTYTLTVAAPSLVAGLGAGAISLSNVSQGAPDAAASTEDSSTKHLDVPITTHANHAWLISGAVNGWSGDFYPVANQDVRFTLSGEFDLMGSTKEVAVASPDSMLGVHLVIYRMSHSVIALDPASGINAAAKVFLQGPYNTGTNAMNTSLRTGGQLAAHFASALIPGNAVDSVNIEIRDSSTGSRATVRAYAPAWLLADGTIKGFPDTTKGYVSFGSVAPGNYYLVVHHRNHLAVMSAVKVSLSGGTSPVAYDFSTGQGQAFGSNPLRAVGTRFAMPGGDGNGDGGIDALDRNLVWRVQNGTNGYFAGDFNLDGGVDALDLNLIWRPDNGTATQVP